MNLEYMYYRRNYFKQCNVFVQHFND